MQVVSTSKGFVLTWGSVEGLKNTIDNLLNMLTHIDENPDSRAAVKPLTYMTADDRVSDDEAKKITASIKGISYVTMGDSMKFSVPGKDNG